MAKNKNSSTGHRDHRRNRAMQIIFIAISVIILLSMILSLTM
jgi:predicted nucleic acid-binding Zn ribbon protein